jgi:hypothetical protein
MKVELRSAGVGQRRLPLGDDKILGVRGHGHGAHRRDASGTASGSRP